VFTAAGDLTDPGLLRDVAAEAGVPPAAVHAAMEDPATRERVRAQTAAAVAAGVAGVPSLVVGGEVFWGDDRLEAAAAAAARAAGAG
jgi:2-hydroxychromene-2-carboxylate isomerase